MNSPGRVRHIRVGINALAHCVNEDDNKTNGQFTNIQRLKKKKLLKKKKKEVQIQSQTIDASKTR